ncbi:amino acid ABC transporter permease [Herbiconiux ginsengi]|uniref:Polar amino acid transport system permease protein n=1 Tax=Herbiconiux ginsengi TaxID=381665 RepID=A0A1H3KXY9_9MICO|nr:amino acid ABC transporter permease [Herbiconiux ginsengi]SDY56504.1 polar amino acid transport system permease protein [Herbiconiux ginsengi]
MTEGTVVTETGSTSGRVNLKTRSLLTRENKLNVVPVRHWGRGVLAVVSVIVLISVVLGLWTNPNIQWPIVGEFLFSPAILKGLGTTLEITAVSMVFALVLAVVIAVMRISPSRIVSGFAAGYVFIFRGVPLIVLLIFVGNLGLFFQNFAIGIPFTDITFWSVPVKEVMTPFLASVIGLSLAGSGYMAEIVRGGLLSIGRGQHEAAKALGLNGARTLRYVVLPQALRVLLPPMGNEFISMLKASAIVSVIAGGDLLTVALGISGSNFRTIELLIVATIWYLLVITVLTIVQYFIEKRTAER